MKRSVDTNVVVVAMEGAPRTLFPPDARDAYSLRVIGLVFDSLFAVDLKGRVVPSVAKSFFIDGNRIVVELGERRFCSGRKITSHDVVFSFSKFFERGRLRYLTGVSAVSERKVVFDTRGYILPALREMTFPIFSDDLQDCTSYFKPITFRAGEYVVLKHRDKDFYVVVKGVKNDLSRILEFEKGDIDVLVNAVPSHLLEYVKGIERTSVVMLDGINLTYIAFNTRRVPLYVRRAFALSIPRRKIAEELLEGTAEVSDTFLPPSSLWSVEFDWYGYNPSLARKLLGGKVVNLVWKTSTVSYAIRNINAIAGYLKDVGIYVKVRSLEFGVFFSDISQGKFDVFSLNLVGIKSPEVLLYILHSDFLPPRGINRSFFTLPELDALIDEMLKQKDEKSVRRKIYEIHKLVKEYVPYIPLWFNKDIIVFRNLKIPKEVVGKLTFRGGGDLSFLNQLALYMKN